MNLLLLLCFFLLYCAGNGKAHGISEGVSWRQGKSENWRERLHERVERAWTPSPGRGVT